MNLHHLRYFFDAARLGGTTDAARANFVTQSAISQAIRSLESELGEQLIHHKRNSFELTDAGRVTYSHCETVFGAVENLKADLSMSSKTVVGPLQIAATNSIALSFLTEQLSRLTKCYPDLVIQLKLGNSDQVKEYLNTKQAEIGLILEDDEMEGFEQTVLKKGRFLLVKCPRNKAQLSPERFIITRASKVEVRQLQKSYLKKFKTDIRFHMEVFSWEIIRQLCLGGSGTGYLPDYVIQNDLVLKKLKAAHIDLPTWNYSLVGIRLKSKALSKGAKIFLEKLSGL